MASIGPYEILGRESCAGVGLPYRVRHLDTGRIFILKALPESSIASDEAAEQLVQSLGVLRHPNVLSPEAHGTDAGGAVFLIFPAVDCSSLHWIIAKQRLAEQQVRDLAIAVASTLEAAHQRGLHHGGLQPKSVLVRNDGTVLITDFMLQRMLGPDGESPFSVPRAYIAPDADTGAPSASDMYALGAIVLEALNGGAPGIAGSHATSDLDISPEFAALVRALLSPRAEDRPGASETLALLTGAATLAPVGVTSPLESTQAYRPRRSDISLFEYATDDARERPLGVWLGVGAVAAVALLALAMSLLFLMDGDPDPEAKLGAEATPQSTIEAAVSPAGTREAVGPAISLPSATAAAPTPAAPQELALAEPTQPAPASEPAEVAPPPSDAQAGDDQAIAATLVVARRGPANTAFYRTRDLREVAGLVTGRALQTYTEEAARLSAIDAYIDSVQTGIGVEEVAVSRRSATVVTVETWEHVDRRASTGEVTGSRRATARITYELILTEDGWLIENIAHSILAVNPL